MFLEVTHFVLEHRILEQSALLEKKLLRARGVHLCLYENLPVQEIVKLDGHIACNMVEVV